MGWLREAMIGGHEGRALHHERRAKAHRVAEQRWRDKDYDPYECRASFGRSWGSAELADEWMKTYVRWAQNEGAVLLETPEIFRCYEGHLHVRLNLRWPDTVVIRARYPRLLDLDVGTSYPLDSV